MKYLKYILSATSVIIFTGCVGASSKLIPTKSSINKVEDRSCLNTLSLDEISSLKVPEQELYNSLYKTLEAKELLKDSCENIAKVKYDVIDDNVVLLTVEKENKTAYSLRLERTCCGNRTTITQYSTKGLVKEFDKAVKLMLKENSFSVSK